MTTLREQNLKLKGIMKKNQRPRSSITDPYEKFWPLLDPENANILVVEMEKTISKENGKLKIDWFNLKKLPLDVRKCQIKDLSKKHKLISPDLKTQRSILKMGINEVSRHIEKDSIICCLRVSDPSIY